MITAKVSLVLTNKSVRSKSYRLDQKANPPYKAGQFDFGGSGLNRPELQDTFL
jgi:hypothetical protein